MPTELFSVPLDDQAASRPALGMEEHNKCWHTSQNSQSSKEAAPLLGEGATTLAVNAATIAKVGQHEKGTS